MTPRSACVGIGGLACWRSLGAQRWGCVYDSLAMLSVIVLFSALAGWLALVVGLPATASLLTRGWFGWLPAALLGAGLGSVFGQMVGNHAMFAFGHLYVLLRGQLGRAHPQAFCAPTHPS